ncbi:aspartate/glutamate racemase family protein [Psychrobacillus soli]|uniref:Aspartate/glutamate racemase family protein n=1 Tax=Psychrobacillus soli TaxID=1543965 RepID=A0A544TKF4_9BACI|nr:aspartate/glutamate racemase family protein [Psychrobacillus soli]TQR17926.1 aspartate/glutamate racemase family protein [Psychrobacillus soli]
MAMQTVNKREYGFIEKGRQSKVHMKKGQYISGFSVGILYLDDCWYPILPGNVANLATYDFPVVLKVVPNCTQERIHVGDPMLVEDVIRSAKQFEAEGARVICGACGFFGNFQEQVANAVDIPVFLSSVVQLPWIKTGLKSTQRIGMLTADSHGITPSLYKSCGIDNPDYVVVKDLGRLPEFSAIIESRGSFDNDVVREEVVSAALELVRDNPDIGAILLECSDLPPYAADIQRAVGLPVYDFITMIRWAHMATAQRPYDGFI